MNVLRLCFVGPAHNVTFRRWVQWFGRRGHDVTVLTVEPAEPSDVEGFRQIDLRASGGSRKIGRLIAAWKLVREIRRMNPDLVHVHYLRGLAWGLVASRPHPCVVTPWGSDVLEEQGAFREWYSKPLTRALLRMADLVSVHSEFMKASVERILPGLSSLVRIGWGIDLKTFRKGMPTMALRNRWGIPSDARVIFSPRLARRLYRHETIVQALPLILKAVPRAVLVVTEQFADTDYLAFLKELVSELGVSPSVRFVRPIPYSEMPVWMNLAEVVVMVPDSDGMPNTLLETMACGASLVLKRLPQYRELIQDGIHGTYVAGAPDEIARAVVDLLNDSGKRATMSVANRAVVARLADQNTEMRRMEEYYAKLVSASRDAPQRALGVEPKARKS